MVPYLAIQIRQYTGNRFSTVQYLFALPPVYLPKR
jgi:hypothetical protein